MRTGKFLNRTADLVFGIPLLLFGLYAICADIQAMIYLAHGQRFLWGIGGGTIIGLLPLIIGCRLIFRRSVINPQAPNQDATSKDD